MKPYRWVILGGMGLLVIAIVSYFWATNLMDSLYAYRSPFQYTPLPAGAPTGKPISKRVVMILVDALRIDTATNPDIMPALNRLRDQGASATMHSRTPSYSFQGWTTLLTGGWQELSDGPAMNPPEGESAWTWSQDNVFTAAHRAGLKTAYAGTDYFTQVIPASALDASFVVKDETVENDTLSAEATVKFIQSGEYAFILLHINQVDWAGHHQGGVLDPHWNAAATRADALIEQVAAALDFNTDTIIIVSDHGQIDAGGHGGQDAIVLKEPFVMAGAAVKPGPYADINQADVAPTITTLLGANIPAVSQGRALTEMLTLSPQQILEVESAEKTQQETLYRAYAKFMDVAPASVILTPGQNPVEAYQTALETIQTERLNRERIPRFFLAGALVLASAFFLFKKRGPTLTWMLAATAVYLALFHLIYAIIQGRTYSLSSVLSSGDIIQAAATDTTIAFIAAWLVMFLGLQAYSRKPLEAANIHMGFVFTALSLISLPALWSYVYNGATVTWTLPEMASMFMGFLTILQMLVFSALGLVFTGITSAISSKTSL